MKTGIQTELAQALLSHEKIWANEEKTILAKNILLDLVEKTDPSIIGLLLNNDELKRHFFVEVNGVLVFKLQDFRFFLDKHSINNSYTKYANRIGLTDGNRFLKDNSDIVLDFPFKDCVLNGGQSTEEGEEIYFKRKIKEYILIYKNKNIKLNPIREQKSEWDNEYNIFLENFTQEDKKFIDLIVNSQTENKEINGNTLKEIDILLKKISPISVNQKLAQLNIKDNEVIKWKLDNAYKIVRTAASSSVKKLADEKKEICQQQFFSVISKRDKLLYIVKSDYSKDAKAPRVQVLFAEDYLSISLCDLWTNINTTGLEAEGNVELKNGKKPESLIETIIKLATNENDIVLDYHLGSGTTAAVAHKMNRQYIGIEQMDYIETLAVERMKKVIDGEQGGISKAVNWQGGGEFVYAELSPFNETAKQQILACENSDGIKTLFEGLCERHFLKYNVSVNEFSQIIEEPEFQSLALDEQKQMMLEMLDLNQMYISLSEMDDEQFAGCLNDDDKALSRAFYQSVKHQAEKKDGE